MPLPALVNALADPPAWYPALVGPFLDVSSRYVFYPDLVAHKIRAWVSADGGNTWTQADATNAPSIPASLLRANLCALRDHDSAVRKVYVAYMHTDNTARILPFDLSTGTWDTANLIVGGPTVSLQDGYTDDGGAKLHIEQRPSDGAFILLYQAASESIAGSDYDRVRGAIYLSGAWGASFIVAGNLLEAVGYTSNGVVLGTSNRVHFIIGSIINTPPIVYRMYHRSMNSSDVLGTLQLVTSEVWKIQEPHIGYPILFNSSEIVIGYVKLNTLPNLCDVKAARAVSATDPVWSTEVICSDSATAPTGDSFVNIGITQIDSTRLLACWHRSDVTEQILYAVYAGGAWGAAVILYDTNTGPIFEFFDSTTAMTIVSGSVITASVLFSAEVGNGEMIYDEVVFAAAPVARRRNTKGGGSTVMCASITNCESYISRRHQVIPADSRMMALKKIMDWHRGCPR